MADFDTGIEGYGNDVQSVPNETGDAFLSLSVGNMTVQEIKDYIDYLSVSSGYMTATEIETRINEVAAAAGMLSVQEIQSIVTTAITAAGALTTGSAEQMIELKVAQSILDLNDNKDYINDIRTQFNIESDRLRAELRIVQQDGNQVHSDVQILKQDYEFSIENVNRNLNLFESLLNSIIESKEIYNLLAVERAVRATEFSNINSIINDKDTRLRTELAQVNNKVDLVSATSEANDNSISATIIQTRNDLQGRMSILEVNLRDNAATLSSLMLSGDSLVEKLNAINSVELGEAGNIIIAFQDQLQDTMNEVQRLESDVNEYLNNITTSVDEFNATAAALETTVQNNTTVLFTEVENARGRLSIETAERKIQDDLILKDWGDYTIEINSKVVKLNTDLNSLASQLNDFPGILDRLIQVEQEARIQSDITLNIKIDSEIQTLETRIDNSGILSDLENLRQNLETAKTKYDKAIVQEIKLMFDMMNSEVVRLDSAIDLNKSITDGSINGEQALREQADINLVSSINLETSIRETRVQELKDQITLATNQMNVLMVAVGAGDNTELQLAVDALNTRYLAVFNQIDNIEDTHITDKVAIQSEIAALETVVLSTESSGIANIQAEADARVAGDNGLQNSIDSIATNLINFLGTVQGEFVSLAKVYQEIDNVQLALDAFALNFDDTLQIELSAVKTSIFNLDSIGQNIRADLIAETTTRIAQDLNLNSAIDAVDTKLPIIKSDILSDLALVETTLAGDITLVDDKITLEIQDRIQGDALRNDAMTAIETLVTTRLDSVDALVLQEQTDRTTADQGFDARLIQETQDRIQEDQLLTTAQANETQARTQGDNDLRNLIDAQSATIQSILSSDSEIDLENLRAVLDIIQYITENPGANVTTQLLDGLNTIEANLTALVQTEEDARIAADLVLQSGIDSAGVELQAQIDIQNQARIDQDTATANTFMTVTTQNTADHSALSLRIDQEIIDRNSADVVVSDAVIAEQTRAELQETVLEDAIDTEEINRTLADDDLQDQIDNFSTGQINVTNRVTALEVKEVNLMANLPVEIANLKDLFDLINGNYMNMTTRVDTVESTLNGRIDTNITNLNAETSARLLGDSVLTASLQDARTEFQDADIAISSTISAEVQARITEDNNINALINAITVVNTAQQDAIEATDIELAQEISNRILDTNEFLSGVRGVAETPIFISDIAGGYNDLDEALTQMGTSQTDISNLRTDLTAETTARVLQDGNIIIDLDAEIQNRIDADIVLDTRITTVNAAMTSTVNAVDTRVQTAEATLASIMLDADGAADSFKELKTAIDANKAGIETSLNNAISTLNTSITNNSTLISTEESARISADNNLNTKIDQEILDRANADGTLQTNITNEADVRNTSDIALQSNINNEITARQGADTILQNNIDALPTTLIELTDIPVMTGSELFMVRVNAAGTAVEYVNTADLLPVVRLDTELDTIDITSTTYVIDGVETDRIEKITYSDGRYAEYGYNATPLLTTIEYYSVGDVLLATKAFTYNVNDRLDGTTWTNA